jgi:hypothetical protein
MKETKCAAVITCIILASASIEGPELNATTICVFGGILIASIIVLVIRDYFKWRVRKEAEGNVRSLEPSTILAILASKLETLGIEYGIDDKCLVVFPVDENGFTVSFSVLGDECIIQFGELAHTHIALISIEEAIEMFIRGLSPECRLSVWFRGGKVYKSTIHLWEGPEYAGSSTTYVHTRDLWMFWRKPKIKHFQNNLVLRGPDGWMHIPTTPEP